MIAATVEELTPLIGTRPVPPRRAGDLTRNYSVTYYRRRGHGVQGPR